jgi:hypothetical protein
MGSPGEENVAVRVKTAAEKTVGQKAVAGSKAKGGIACFALVDHLLKSVGAKSAADFGEVTSNADYVWGEEVELNAVQPGDILQFRDHVINITTLKLGELKWEVKSEETLRRPHHTAVVVAVQKDGSVEVVEQNVRPDPKKIRRSVIVRLPEGEDTKYRYTTEKSEIKVTGKVRAYRPIAKAKGAMLLPRNEKPILEGRRILAHYEPSEGGLKRPSGPLGRV